MELDENQVFKYEKVRREFTERDEAAGEQISYF